MGNAALADLAALRSTGPETGMYALPAGECTAAPLTVGFGAPGITEAPAFGAMSPMGAAAPMAV